MKITLLFFKILCLTALLSACATTVSETRRGEIMAQTPELNPTRTWCLGRFLINMPPTAKLYLRTERTPNYMIQTISGEYGGGWKYRLAKIVMPPEKMSLQDFEKKIQARQTELRKAAQKGKDKWGLLQTGGLLQTEHPQPDTYVLATWKDYKKIIEGYRWSKGYMFFLRSEVGDDKQTSGIKNMLERLSVLRARNTDEIPKEDGFCFPGGLMAEKPRLNEEVQLAFVFDEWPDVTFDVDFFPSAEIQEPLLSRRSGVLAALGSAMLRIRTLRSGERPLPGFPGSQGLLGQELLMTVPHRSSDQRAHTFIWEYPGRGSLEAPFLKFELVTGQEESVSLTDEQAIALWDAILNSFKVRPVVPGKRSAVEPEDFARLIASGEKCPQTGYWRCVEQVAPASVDKRSVIHHSAYALLQA